MEKLLITFAIILLLNININAQSNYNAQPGVKNNQIVLQLSNISLTESASNLEVKLIKNSKYLNFNQTEKIIENINQGTETEAAFTFDVDYNIGNVEADTIEFVITDNKSVYLTKQFILQYSVPTEYKLEQNFPNPFNPTTKIRFSIPNVTLSEVEGSRVQIKVFDVLGKEVAALVNEEKPAGKYEVEFDARNLSSGVYFYQLRSGDFIQTNKMILLR